MKKEGKNENFTCFAIKVKEDFPLDCASTSLFFFLVHLAII